MGELRHGRLKRAADKKRNAAAKNDHGDDRPVIRDFTKDLNRIAPTDGATRRRRAFAAVTGIGHGRAARSSAANKLKYSPPSPTDGLKININPPPTAGPKRIPNCRLVELSRIALCNCSRPTIS